MNKDLITVSSRGLIWSIAFLWLWSGLQPMLIVPQESLQLLRQVGVPETMVWITFLAASLLDVSLGILCFTRLRFQAAFWWGQWCLVLIYSFILAFRLPEMWWHPFAPLIKNVPILAMLWCLARSVK